MHGGETQNLSGQNLLDKAAWVTGGAGGLGRAAALALARAGADVAVADVDGDGVAAVAEEVRGLGRRSLALTVDVADSAQVERMADEVAGGLGRLDIAVQCAGILLNHTAVDCPDAQWREVMGVNLDGLFWCCRAAGRRLIAQGEGGRIINIASVSARVADWPRDHVSYSASKAGAVMLTRYLAVEWGEHAITVNSISPGNVETAMTAGPEEWRRRWRAATPLGRLATPEEIAAAVVFLAGAGAAYVTGQDLVIDGGATCGG